MASSRVTCSSTGPSLMCPVSMLSILPPSPLTHCAYFQQPQKQKSSACIGVQSDFATVWLDRAPGNDASLCAVLLGLVQSELHTRNYQ